MAYPYRHDKEVRLLSEHFGDPEARPLEGWKKRGAIPACRSRASWHSFMRASITRGTGQQVEFARSFKIGVIRLTERFVKSDPLSGGDELARLGDGLDDDDRRRRAARLGRARAVDRRSEPAVEGLREEGRRGAAAERALVVPRASA